LDPLGNDFGVSFLTVVLVGVGVDLGGYAVGRFYYSTWAAGEEADYAQKLLKFCYQEVLPNPDAPQHWLDYCCKNLPGFKESLDALRKMGRDGGQYPAAPVPLPPDLGD
jgi:hypothetical protein